MRLRFVCLASLLALVCGSVRASAQPMPPPYVPPPWVPTMPLAGTPLPPMPLPPVPYRPSAYRWQYYERNYYGYLRPIVIQTGNGGYYLHNGAPFPWVNVYPGEHRMPLGRDFGPHQ
jgi:hypothetical protein